MNRALALLADMLGAVGLGVVDLNRIRLPADTPIVDKRFKVRETERVDRDGK